MRISFVTDVFDVATANHATWSSTWRVCPAPCRAQGTAAHHHPVLAAGHPRGVGLQHRLHRAQVQRPPPPPTRPLVVTPATAQADPTPQARAPCRPHVRDQPLRLLVELDPLHRRVLDAEQPRPYPSVAHAVPPRLRHQPSDSRKPRQDNGVPATTRSTHPQKGQESPSYDDDVLATTPRESAHHASPTDVAPSREPHGGPGLRDDPCADHLRRRHPASPADPGDPRRQPRPPHPTPPSASGGDGSCGGCGATPSWGLHGTGARAGRGAAPLNGGDPGGGRGHGHHGLRGPVG